MGTSLSFDENVHPPLDEDQIKIFENYGFQVSVQDNRTHIKQVPKGWTLYPDSVFEVHWKGSWRDETNITMFHVNVGYDKYHPEETMRVVICETSAEQREKERIDNSSEEYKNLKESEKKYHAAINRLRATESALSGVTGYRYDHNIAPCIKERDEALERFKSAQKKYEKKHAIKKSNDS